MFTRGKWKFANNSIMYKFWKLGLGSPQWSEKDLEVCKILSMYLYILENCKKKIVILK